MCSSVTNSVSNSLLAEAPSLDLPPICFLPPLNVYFLSAHPCLLKVFPHLQKSVTPVHITDHAQSIVAVKFPYTITEKQDLLVYFERIQIQQPYRHQLIQVCHKQHTTADRMNFF